MLRAILIALAGQGCFIISVITLSPLRLWEKPVVNYNLFYVPVMAVIVGFLFYRACVEEKESKSYLYGFFAALAAWPLLGEVASMPVDKGLITQFSGVNIKLLGGYFYVVPGWIMLNILWRTGALKKSVCVFFMTFLSIWTFELYMDNYSSKVSMEMMPTIGNTVGFVSLVMIIVLLVMARRAVTVERKTVIGCILYIALALFLMGFGPWKNPSIFYIKYEAKHIEKEIAELQEEREHIKKLKKRMIARGLIKVEGENKEAEQKAKPQPQ